MRLKPGIILLVLSVLLLFVDGAWAAKGDVYIVNVNDAISPGIAEYIKSSIEQAEKEEAACLIIELDTPGGLAESMRLIIKDILGSSVPIVVFVAACKKP